MTRTQLKRLPVDEAIELYKSGKLSNVDYALYCLERGLMDWPEVTKDGLRSLRRKYDLTQKEMALLLGVSQQTIMRWEGQAETVPAPIRLVIRKMDSSMDEFLGHLQLMPGHPEYAKEFRKKFNAEMREVEKDNAITPLELSGDDEESLLATRSEIINLRRRLSMSRGEFAQFLHVSPSSVDKWENGTSRPLGVVEIFLKILARDDLTSQKIVKLLKKSIKAKAKADEQPDPNDHLVD